MAYSPGNRDSEAESRLPRGLFAAVAVLGLVTYALSFGPIDNGSGASGWYVRFAVLAGLSAALGLLPRQTPHTVVTSVLAAAGFLDALSSRLLAADAGWALTLIVVLNAGQAAVAVAALLVSPKARTDTVATAGYDAYVEYYNQAVRDYYGQQAQSPTPTRSQGAGYGEASADAHGSSQARAARRAPQYGDYADFVSPQGEYGHSATSAGSPAGQSMATPPSGLPRFGPAQPPAGRPEKEAGQSAWPPSP